MNLITIKNNGEFYCFRPDTSLNRDSNNYFCPEEINELSVVFFNYIKIGKGAKSVNPKFAERYVTHYGYGLSLRADNLLNPNDPYSIFKANSLDNSTFISGGRELITENINLAIIDNTEYRIGFNDNLAEIYPNAIGNISRYTSLRTGDMILFEYDRSIKIERGNCQINDNSEIKFGELSVNIIW